MRQDRTAKVVHLKDQLYTGQSKYMINGSKTLKGHKLYTNDYINVQLLKFRNCSADVYNEGRDQLDITNNEFKQKYKGFHADIMEDSEIVYDLIAEKRRKKTEEVKTRLKMFEDNRGRMQLQQHMNRVSKSDNKQMLRQKLALQGRSNHADQSHLNKTISFNQPHHNESSIQPTDHTKRQFFCTTSNLGQRMNKYLNTVVLQRSHNNTTIAEEQSSQSEQLFRNCRTLQFNHRRMDPNRNKGIGKPLNLNSYLRNMKKFKRIKQNLDRDNEDRRMNELKSKVQCTISIVNQKCAKYNTVTSYLNTQNSLAVDDKMYSNKFKTINSSRAHKHAITG